MSSMVEVPCTECDWSNLQVMSHSEHAKLHNKKRGKCNLGRFKKGNET